MFPCIAKQHLARLLVFFSSRSACSQNPGLDLRGGHVAPKVRGTAVDLFLGGDARGKPARSFDFTVQDARILNLTHGPSGI